MITVFMTGVIWIVQIVVYPQFRYVENNNFVRFEQAHMQRIFRIVGPVMILEFITALILLMKGIITGVFINSFYLSLVLGVIIGISTAFIQVPLHRRLAKDGKHSNLIERLIKTNWIRTVCWSGRSILIGWIVFQFLL